MKKPSKYVSRKEVNGHIPYTKADNDMWHTLITRQDKLLPGRAIQEYIDGLAYLDLPRDRVPQPSEVNEKLQAKTGWSIQTVEAIIPPEEFFGLLADRRFPAASFIRLPEDLDYIEEPDIFHEVYGHCPLLTNQAYADFIEQYGKIALKASKKERKYLLRLFWFTIEFGLIKTPQGMRIYGGGILSSPQETVFALEKHEHVNYAPLDVSQVLRMPYRIDILQTTYFVINHLDDLARLLDEQRIKTLIAEAAELGDFEVDLSKLC